VIEIHANGKRAGFGRAIRGETRQEFSMDLECGLPVGCALLYARQRESDIPDGVEVDCAFGHWSARFLWALLHFGTVYRFQVSAYSFRIINVIGPSGELQISRQPGQVTSSHG